MHARLSFGAEIDQLAKASLLWNVCGHMKHLQSSSISASLRFWHAFASASCLGRAGRVRSTGLDVIGKHGASVPRGALTGSARTALQQKVLVWEHEESTQLSLSNRPRMSNLCTPRIPKSIGPSCTTRLGHHPPMAYLWSCTCCGCRCVVRRWISTISCHQKRCSPFHCIRTGSTANSIAFGSC